MKVANMQINLFRKQEIYSSNKHNCESNVKTKRFPLGECHILFGSIDKKSKMASYSNAKAYCKITRRNYQDRRINRTILQERHKDSDLQILTIEAIKLNPKLLQQVKPISYRTINKQRIKTQTYEQFHNIFGSNLVTRKPTFRQEKRRSDVSSLNDIKLQNQSFPIKMAINNNNGLKSTSVILSSYEFCNYEQNAINGWKTELYESFL